MDIKSISLYNLLIGHMAWLTISEQTQLALILVNGQRLSHKIRSGKSWIPELVMKVLKGITLMIRHDRWPDRTDIHVTA